MSVLKEADKTLLDRVRELESANAELQMQLNLARLQIATLQHHLNPCSNQEPIQSVAPSSPLQVPQGMGCSSHILLENQGKADIALSCAHRWDNCDKHGCVLSTSPENRIEMLERWSELSTPCQKAVAEHFCATLRLEPLEPTGGSEKA